MKKSGKASAKRQRARVDCAVATPAPVQARVVELFAGVGGFRLGLEGEPKCLPGKRWKGPWRVVWANQWEPTTRSDGRRQFAYACYRHWFGGHPHGNEDIHAVLDMAESGEWSVPDHELLAAGFPCQDYSVAKPLNQAHGIVGKKGVLWWDIYRLLQIKVLQDRPPRFLLLENVDRLLNSPGSQRGRDFAIILSCLAGLGYAVEWRVVNAADYGLGQKRRRVFIVGQLTNDVEVGSKRALERLLKTGILATALPARLHPSHEGELPLSGPDFVLEPEPELVSADFGKPGDRRRFLSGGVMVDGRIWTRRLEPVYERERIHLRDIVEKTGPVPESFFVPDGQLDAWRYLKGRKDAPRTHKGSGTKYFYKEGALPFPDPLDRPARTILTGEGGASPSRFRHIIQDPKDGRFRRLVPEELEALNGFPRGWTDTGMSDIQRAFCMGNALVVGIVRRIGKRIFTELQRTAREGCAPVTDAAVERSDAAAVALD